jgi:large subunit ribosomal protein L4
MQVDVYKKDGTPSGEKIDLPEGVFGVEPNDHVMWLSVKAYLAHQRQGTSKTKNRWEVSGGGRKPWKQKGRGTARSGSNRSPLWVGGGNVHGPQPRTYDMKIPRKVGQLARKSALSFKIKSQQLRVVEDFTFESIKTKQMVDVLKAFDLTTSRALLLTATSNQILWKSGRNIATCDVKIAEKASAYDILNNKMVLIQKSAVQSIVASFQKKDA